MIYNSVMTQFRIALMRAADHIRYRIGDQWTNVSVWEDDIDIIGEKIRVKFNVSCAEASIVNRVELCDENDATLIGADCEISIAASQSIMWWFDITVTEGSAT